MRSHVRVNILLTGLTMASAQSLPYNPTIILSNPKNNDIPYIFLPVSGSTGHRLVTLNISSTLNPANITFNTVSSTLPFTSDDTTAFVPSIAGNGNIYVYAGSCTTSTSSALWKFTQQNESTIGNGSWTQQSTTTASDVTSASLPGADFLAQGFSFSTLAGGNATGTEFYVFGGMCPNSTSTTADWQAAANYSNHMLRLAPTNAGKSYTLDVAAARGPPIAEAGMTVTGLTPSYSTNLGVATQAQNFVLLGGHTQTAFINMSQVAIWSLPEESWSFVNVDSPSTSSPNTELAIKSTVTSVDSRSGHTAVLSEDGTKVIVFGGWVGDITQAADPQLAVLNLGTGFGGTGDWKWSVPANQPGGNGIYGHGAVMLPGDVMMIVGGVNISSGGSTKRSASSGAQAQFYNTTSGSWVSNYTNPAYIASQNKSNGSSSLGKKLGLGLGLGLGLAVILAALLFYFCYSRHLRKTHREQREKNLNDLSRGASSFYHSPGHMVERRSSFPWSNNGWNNNNEAYDSSNHDHDSAVVGYENLHNGVHNMGDVGDIPNPPRQITRKPLHSRARGSYQPASAYDTSSHGRAANLGTAGAIHPIYEADENGNDADFTGPVGLALGGESSSAPGTAESKRYSDPFRDLVTSVAPPSRQDTLRSVESETPHQEREREIQEWVSDWAAADLLMNSQARSYSGVGRVSPTRRAQFIAATTVSSVSGEEFDSARTESNLSERTERSVALSAVSVSHSGSSKSNSLRGFITGINPFATNNVPFIPQSTAGGSTALSTVFSAVRAPARNDSASGRSAKSFNTAHTSFPTLQAEGETLLPRPGIHEDGYASPEHSLVRSTNTSYMLEPPGSPSKNKGKLRGGQLIGANGRSGWLGSIKKRFITTASTEESASSLSRSMNSSPQHLDPDLVTSTRTGVGGLGTEPRRAVSAGAQLWRRKQGKSDWDDSLSSHEASHHYPSTSSHPHPLQFNNSNTGDLGERSPGFSLGSGMSGRSYGDDDEWDIERAVENRVVQVMFTVPRERLRVVNAADGEERNSLESSSSSGEALIREEGDAKSNTRQTHDGVMGESQWLSSASKKEKEMERDRIPSPSPSKTGSEKSKSRVMAIVERMEGQSREAL